MGLNVRLKQRESVIRMLNFNARPSALKQVASEEEAYKVLVLDRATKDILAPLLRVNELRKQGVTLHLQLGAPREAIQDVPAIYYVQATAENIDAILRDAAAGLYSACHLNFAYRVDTPLLQRLAEGAVAAGCSPRIARVHDQYTAFVSLESRLFSLGLPTTFLALNEPAADEAQIQGVIDAVVEGLFSVLVTMGVQPIIRCPKGPVPAAAVGRALHERLVSSRALFSDSAAGFAAPLNRPLLCLFDRSFELSVALQHTWTYKPQVADVLGLHLNRIAPEGPPAGAPPVPSASPAAKQYEVGDGDFFWEEYGHKPFEEIAKDLHELLAQYKQDVEELNAQTGSHLDPNAAAATLSRSHTEGLMAAVNALPALTARKAVIDKHQTIAHRLLAAITSRTLDQFHRLEGECVQQKADLPAVLKLLGTAGTPQDKLRLALVYLLTCEALPSEGDYGRMAAALTEAGADLAALGYVRRMRRLNLMGKAGDAGFANPGAGPSPSASSAGLASLAQSQHQILSWADKAFGQGLSTITKGVRNYLVGEQQAALTVAVEQLLEGRPETLEAFTTLDPKGSRAVAPGPKGEALVFMVGGGCYLEAESLATWAARTKKTIAYGATELLSPLQFTEQLAELGRRTGV